MDRSGSGRLGRDPFDRWVPALLMLLAALIVLARLWLVFQRLYDPDELQHLHAGYCVWRGMVPYRDFFEQHQPVLWYLSLPLFHIWGASLSVLFAGRVLIWFVGAMTVALTWLVGARTFGRFAGSIAALLLVLHPPYQEKNVEWRPDNLAVPLLLAALLCLDRTFGGSARRWAMLAGGLLSCAFFCTQKVAYVECGMLAGLALAVFFGTRASPNLERHASWKRLGEMAIALASGSSLVVVFVLGFFCSQGAMHEFIDLTLVAPVQWQTREPMLRYLINQLAAGAVFWSAGVAGWILVVAKILKYPIQSPVLAVIAGGALTHTLGLLHVPAAFHQYYLPLSPLVALLAAYALDYVALGEPVQYRTALLLASLASVAVTVTALAVRSLDTYLSPLWIPAMSGLLVVAAALGLMKLRQVAALLVLVVSAMGTMSYHLIQYRDWRHEGQTRRIEQLIRATGDDDRFFDGFTGYGALRPHAFFVFWINHHSWPMIPAAHRQSGIVNALQDPHTRVVLFDRNLARFLGNESRQLIEQHFEPDSRYSDLPTVIVYARRDRPLPNIEP